ncbi:MAG TPA: ATP-binding protein, partial [Chthoniobacteraceae bacterium]|nr:ATP-binding protein [Chthoniobacteraceae bacterium]
ICTAYSDYSLEEILTRLGRTDRMLILKKPFDAIEVLQFADALTEKWRLSRDARAKVDDLEARIEERSREIREGERQLIEARKMELVGKLAGGIAHDFNTLLTSIIGHAELVRQDAAEDSQFYRSAAEIGKSATAAATLTQQLLAFSRRQMLKPELLDLNATVHTMESHLRQALGPGIEVTVTAHASRPWTWTDPGQFRQVLISLAHNSRDAMPHGGQFIVETSDVTLAEPETDMAAGDYVMITVTDSGAGIPEDARPHIFEPFFTTKTPGEGKGLGLAMCHGILKQGGGHIVLRAGPHPRGTVFAIYLPRYQRIAESAPAQPQEETRGNGVILLVEEDDTLRGMAATVLQQSGYTVHRATNSREAITVAGRLSRVDLLLASAALPEMTGPELAEWLVSLHPSLKELYVIPPEAEEPADAGAAYLRKPYAPALLTGKVRETMAN